ncbi:MAG TPA: aspartate carbamoyltransferase, partial [Candidatus Micrarchaeota archaeon]|nr:aspartate carbamoyltransferase [Candidatus Micrarchaeota archaeon]
MDGLISIRDCEKGDLEEYLELAEKMEALLKSGKRIIDNKIVACMFFEPSTRTNMSFQAAAKRLGADVIAFNSELSSSKKGESLIDTVRIIDGYADVLVIRHPGEGAARIADRVAKNPVVNAGDGGNQHPTQTLIDLYTIKKSKGDIEGLNIHLVGDLKHARAMRSLVLGLAMFGARITLVSPKGLEMDKEIVAEARERHKADVMEM